MDVERPKVELCRIASRHTGIVTLCDRPDVLLSRAQGLKLCGLNLEDCDLARGTTWIKGKGRRERELIPLPDTVVAAIRRYLKHRGGTQRGPLFLTRSGRISKDGSHRIQIRSVLRIVRRLGLTVGIKVWRHALRHSTITTAIEKGQQAGVGLDQIRHFSRHRTLATMLIYRDEHDQAGVQRTLADIVASTVAASRDGSNGVP